MRIDWNQYDPGDFYDELISSPGQPRPAARGLANYLKSLGDQQLARRQRAAELAIEEMGITFTVYSEGENIDRAWPFDIIPRVIPLKEWLQVEAGLKQRITALNLFIDDIYNARRVIKDKVFPEATAGRLEELPAAMRGLQPAFRRLGAYLRLRPGA